MKFSLFLFTLLITTKAFTQPTVKDYENKTIFAVDGKYEKAKRRILCKKLLLK